MKTKPLLLCFLSCLILNAQAQKSKFERTILQVAQAINSATGQLQSVTVQTVEVNSISKARFGGGHTRYAIPINIPVGTQKWFYRITVMDIKENYSYASNESLYYMLSNHLTKDAYAPTNNGIDFFLLGSSGDAASFSETGNNNFQYLLGYDRLNSNSFIGEGSGAETGR